MRIIRFPIIIVVVSCISGCSLDDVREHGDKCEGDILYIYSETMCTKENASECTIEQNGKNKKHDFSSNFANNVCPWQFPECRPVTYSNKTYYACEEKLRLKEKCADNELECSAEDGKVICIDPSNDKTCGANSCDVDVNNYGGMNCRLYNANCENTGLGSYACITADDVKNLVCSGNLIDPSNKETCGADDCSKDNYGGIACSESENCRFTGIGYECIGVECDEQCLFHDDNGIAVCINTNAQCGPDCIHCADVHENAACTNGKCTISECFGDEHPIFEGTQIVRCEKTTLTACASNKITIFDRIANCEDEKSENVEDIICNSQGRCEVTRCKTGSHVNASKTTCLEDSLQICTNPDTGISFDCTSIENIESVSCTAGKCIVDKCIANYHINSERTGCDANSDTSCAPSDSNSPVNCTDTPQKTCTNGTCQCSDSSKVLNYTGTACVIAGCQGLPGVKAGKMKNNVCYPTSCDPDYNAWRPTDWSVCRPTSDCQNKGYKNAASNGVCYGCESSMCKTCSHSYCKTGYRHYHTACYPQDACCGKSTDSATCINCLASNKKCNTNTGKCE